MPTVLRVALTIPILAAFACGDSTAPSDGGGGSTNDGAGGSGAAGAGGNPSSGGGGEGVGGDGGESSGGGPTGGGGMSECGPALCAPGVCGTTASCEEPVTCDLCRYEAETVEDAFFGPLPYLAIGDEVSIAYGTTFATRGSPWALETIDAEIEEVIDAAIAPDGTPWILAMNSGNLVAAHRTETGWLSDIVGDASVGAIAVAEDGTVFVVYDGVATGALDKLSLAIRSAGMWTKIPVHTGTGLTPENVDVAVAGSVAWVTWADFPDTAIYAARVEAGTVEVETVDPDHSSYDQPVSIVVDAAGEPHIAYRYDEPGDRRILHAARSAGTWTIERSIVLRLESQGPLGLAISSGGEIVMGAVDDEGIYIGTRHDGRWFTQRILPGCQDDHFDLEFDASDTLHVAHRCRGNVELYSRTDALFPGDYAATCEEAATTLCATSCQCGAGDCCFDGGDHCVSPEGFCQVVVQSSICGDAAQDPTLLYQCNDAAPGKVCAGTSLEDVPECPEI